MNLLWQSALTAISWRKQSNEFSDRRMFNSFETPADLAQAAREYGRETQRGQLSYITQTGSAGQQACLREEGLSTSNINTAFLDTPKDIFKSG
ncbi:hypothetical protein PROFUN_14783 [Planoprotostelium fungivorum]|uniref:Uncharacterized protein n=1 Tax=Planoprotostelium fungivorum TaxID=1890364 RepID=A0A2P6MYI4_9EUKA|nr:hypothetical protein PROFUN_14783 [Planoprotostelium fungivorum]